MLLRLAAFFLAAGLAAAQTNSVTVTASRNASVPPDVIVFAISVDSPTSTSRDDVAAALRGAGLTTAFSSVNTTQQYDARNRLATISLGWRFTVFDEMSNMKTAVDRLAAAQKAIAELKNGMTMSFSLSHTELSARVQQSQACSMQDLIADARAKAMKLAAAAAMGLGPILAISGATTGPDPAGSSPFAPPTYLPVCSLTVKFALGGL
jgi:uncharacterized protein YggE